MSSEENAILENMIDFLYRVKKDRSDSDISEKINTRFKGGYSDEYYTEAFKNFADIMDMVRESRKEATIKLG